VSAGDVLNEEQSRHALASCVIKSKLVKSWRHAQ